ncbi:MAG TPA: hypothetical protein ENJ95_19425 [Bacteroidetes bacterium]|nr:hypothetical protein [Bacteroidota bacterium]
MGSTAFRLSWFPTFTSDRGVGWSGVNATDRDSLKAVLAKKYIKSKNMFFQKSHLAWLILLPIVSFIYDSRSVEPYQDVRFLFTVFFLSIHSILYFYKNDNIYFVKSRTGKLFFGAGILFSIWAVVTSFFAVNYYQALIPISRILIFGLLVYFMLASFSKIKSWAVYFKIFTLLVLFHAFVGICQTAEIAFTGVPGNWQPNGFMGHRNLFGSYIAAGLCFPIFLFVKEKGFWKWLGAVVLFVCLLAIAFSQTRAAWMEVVLTLLVLLLGWVGINGLSDVKHLARPITAGLLAFLLIVIVAVFAGPEVKSSIGKRLASFAKINAHGPETDEAVGSVQFRFRNWGQTVEMFKDHPLTGVGLDNWKVVVPKYGLGGYPVDAGLRVRARPHNVYLKILGEMGLVGFLLFVFVLITVAYTSVKNIFSKKTKKEDRYLFLFFGTGYFVFLFDMIPSFSVARIEQNILFAFFVAAILSLHEKQEKGKHVRPLYFNKIYCATLGFVHLPPPAPSPKRGEPALDAQNLKWRSIIIAGSAAILLYSLVMSFSRYKFDKNFKNIIDNNKAGNYKNTIRQIAKAKSIFHKLNYFGEPVELFSAEAYISENKYGSAINELEQALIYHPNSAKILSTFGTVYMTQREFGEAAPYFERALKFTPFDVSIKRELAVCYFNLGRYRACMELLQTFDIKGVGNLEAMYERSLEEVYGQ